MGGADVVRRGDREVKVSPMAAEAGVPLKVAVPSPLSTNVTPLGSVGLPSESVGSGTPVVVTVKVPAVPAAKDVLSALVMEGAVSTIVGVMITSAAVDTDETLTLVAELST